MFASRGFLLCSALVLIYRRKRRMPGLGLFLGLGLAQLMGLVPEQQGVDPLREVHRPRLGTLTSDWETNASMSLRSTYSGPLVVNLQ